jgi:para-aminobenzoate synthetase component 1
MIVDLVRNDLSRIALKDSVKVDELCAIYSFETVHQMISSISCEISQNVSFTDVLKATFPMGSMTGAPKIRAMELIEAHESFKRGLYSGSIGYISPNGDFDFNVVIRTLLYNNKEKYLSCSVGGAITIQSDPEKEYAECMFKVKRILDGMNA